MSVSSSGFGLTPPPSRFSVAVCRFPNTGDDWYVLVGVARDMILNPKSVGGGFIYTYRLVSGGEKLEFVHKVGSSRSTGDPGCRVLVLPRPPPHGPGLGRAEPPLFANVTQRCFTLWRNFPTT